jgi:hypothetical protein
MTPAIVTLVISLLTLGLTQLTKNTVITSGSRRDFAVRALAAFFSLALTIITALVTHVPLDQGAVAIFVTAVLAWLGSLGIYHAPKAS